ncbi:hypothetical protein ACS0TY_000194 [Phlomoides rotata]
MLTVGNGAITNRNDYSQNKAVSQERPGQLVLHQVKKIVKADISIYTSSLGTREVGFGFLVRNDTGKVVMVGSNRSIESGSSTPVEVLAVLYALQNASNSVLGNMVIETDSEVLSKTLHEEMEGHCSVALVAEDIIMLAREIVCTSILSLGQKRC